MSDETKKPAQEDGGWVMPEPIFRSSEGHTPRTAQFGPQDDIPTEPGFSDETTDETIEIPVVSEEPDVEEPHQAVRATTKTKIRHHKKRSGCAKVFGLIAGAVAVALTSIFLVLVYFLYFYRPAETTF